MGSPKKPSGPFLKAPALAAAFLCPWCQGSVPLKGVGGREDRRVSLLPFGLSPGKTGSSQAVRSSEFSPRAG